MKKGINALFLTALVLWNLGPFLWQWLTSFKDPAQVNRLPPLLPETLTWDNYRSVLANEQFLKVILNSMEVSLGATLISLLLGSMAAYGISRLMTRGKGVVLFGLLVVFMLPQVALVTPLYKVMGYLNLKNTLGGLILVYTVFSVPLVVWIMHQTFEELPDSLHQAARIDGCGHWRIFYRIYLPLGVSGLISAGLLSLIFCWNEFLFALTFTSTYDARTIPVGITLFSGQFAFPWGEISAASSIVTLPILLIVVAAQKYLVRGLAGTGNRG